MLFILWLINWFFVVRFGIPQWFWILQLLVNISLYAYIWYRYPQYFLNVCTLWVFGCVIEYIGVITCFPYWCFGYSDILWPKIAHTFPINLFFIWPLLVIWITTLHKKNIYWTIPGLILFDLILDPAAVYLWFWRYADPGIYFGVPWTNYAWRVLASIISIYILKKSDHHIFIPEFAYGIVFMTWFFGYIFVHLIFS